MDASRCQRYMLCMRWSIGLVFLAGCATGTIPGTQIEDTQDNRAVLEKVEEYKRAVEALDAEAVLALVSPRYYEDNGNTDAADDYDYKGLQVNLRKDFERTRAIQLVLRVDAVEVEEETAFAEVYYQIRAQNEYPSGIKWDTGSDRARLTFERRDGNWLIISGL